MHDISGHQLPTTAWATSVTMYTPQTITYKQNIAKLLIYFRIINANTFLVIFLIVFFFTAPIQKNCEIKKTDVIFLLDSSSSIEESDYKKMLEFVSAFVDDTPTIGQKGTQVGIYTFATGFRNIIKLGRYQEKAALKSAIISINQTGGMTKTNLALDDILKNGFDPRADARPDAQRAVVVITDGKSEDTQKTKEAAAALHRENIFTMAIGVGKLVDKKELEVIATTGENAFTVKNFQALKTIEEQVNSVICVNKNISKYL